MSKDLEKPLMTIENPTPLQALAKIETRLHINNEWKYSLHDLEVIKNTLVRLEEIDNGVYVPIVINRYNELCDKEDVLKIIKKKGVFVHLLKHSKNATEYNTLILVAFKKMVDSDCNKATEMFCLNETEFNKIKEWLEK